MIKEKYSDHLYSGEMLAILEISGTPACILDVHHQTVTLNSGLSSELMIDEAELHLSNWLSLFRIHDRGEIYRVIHQLAEWDEAELTVTIPIADVNKTFSCKLLHLSNGDIAVIFSSLFNQTKIPSQKSYQYTKKNPLPSCTVLNLTETFKTQAKTTRTSKVKERLVEAADNFPYGLAMLNSNWEVIYANSVMENMVDLPLSKYYRKKLWDLFSVDDYNNFFQHCLRAMETQETVEFQGTLHKKGIMMDLTIVPSEQGITIIAKDITWYMDQFERLRKSENRFSIITNHIKEACWVCSPETGELVFLSDSFTQIYGVDKEIILNDPPRLFDLIDKEYLDQVKEAALIMTQKEHQVEFTITTPDGESKWIRMKGFPAEDDGKQYVVGIDEEITKIKEMTLLEEKSRQLSTITQMAAGVAHEIKNPLTAIKGFLQIGAVNPDLRDSYHDIILDEVNRIESIVQDFMMLSKPKSSVQLEYVNLDAIISYVSRLLDPDTSNKEVMIHYTCDSKLNGFYCEPKRLKQILINLVSNAMDALDEDGEVQIEAVLQNDELIISVIDNGHGLSEQELTKLGEPFYTTKEKGTGLGIMVTKKMIDDLDGRLNYQSSKNEGTCVTVRLPFRT
ncbi:ATP-binding protein [Halobacillus campisalis]|uniref:histidine kinase n=1 Tax=Halobacillus campisalis TaxID=435909 RepID=A0ABW2K7U3_9BACI|nr:ATP-binding protein [Halobacillus campisalis]